MVDKSSGGGGRITKPCYTQAYRTVSDVLVTEGLTKRFPGRNKPAIEGVNLEVRDGEILGLVGLNGAGKSTTIRVAAGVVLPTSGRVLVDGHDIARDKRRASELVGWMPELFPFEPEARALSLLTYYAGFHGLTGPAARSKCRESLAQVGLAEVERGRIRTFSQGMKKRFSLAAATIGDPSNLLLDEILNGLDPEGIAFVRGWMVELRRQHKAILLSSHILAELQTLADRVSFVHEGRILRTIDREELVRAGNPALRLVVENPDDSLIPYLAQFGKPVVEGRSILLSQPTIEAATLNAELGRRGYRVAEIRPESTSLEAYFLTLIGAVR